jgi:2',3'-cyclic-nucleotide 2'-phosphodiesterase (5'-nucleotidase family)
MDERALFLLDLLCWQGYFQAVQIVIAPQGAAAQIAVMVTGDLESRIVPQDVSRDGETLSLGGLARIAAAAEEIRGAADGALLLSAGNDVLGSFYYIFEGEPEMQGMEMAGYDVVTPGHPRV